MTFEEFVKKLADVEGKAALEKFAYDWWQQATEEERAKLILAIDQLTGIVRKMAKGFWECCGIAIRDGWVCVDGKNYTISPELVGKKEPHLELERIVFPEKIVVKSTTEFKMRDEK
jgi:hypothetical protein